VDHRKVTVTPDDLQKLKTLLREQEERVDAMETEAELAAAERELEEKIRRLARSSPTEISTQNRDENWEKIQPRLNPLSESEAETGSTASNVVPLRKQQNTWGWLGAFAAAALALFVLYPKMQDNQNQMTVDPTQSLTKGNSGAAAFTASCDVDVRGKTNEAVQNKADGSGFEVSVGETVEILYSCNHDGYMQVWNNGHPAEEFRNLPVRAGEKTGIIQEGKLVEFPLQGGDSWVFSVVLTDSKIGSDVDLLELKDIPSKLGVSQVLWYDSIAVKGKAQ
jgi:hypothetical protein